MLRPPTFSRRSQTTAAWILILVGSLFLVAGCAQLYRTIGMSEDQVAHQVTQDQAVKEHILQGIRFTTTEIITTAIAGLGAITSGFLAKWFGTERKITKALITGIEEAPEIDVKKTVQGKAILLGVEKKLNARVRALT